MKMMMKNKNFFVSLILLTTLFFGQYLIHENKKKSEIDNSPLDHGSDKTDLHKILKTPPKLLLTAPPISEATNGSTEDYVSKAEILEALKKAKAEELNALALLWKSNLCPECIESLKQILANHKLDKELRTNAALVLAKIGSHESIVALIQSLNKKTIQISETKLLQKIASESISAIYDPAGIGALAYVLTGQQDGITPNRLPAFLVSEMNNAMVSFSDKNGVAYEITKQYWNTQDSQIQENIINLNHPQTLAALAIEAEASGDFVLQKNVIGKLTASPNSDNLDALMSIAQKTSSQDAELSAKIDEWTQANIQTDDSAGHLIDYLSNPDVSEKQREIAVELLTDITQNQNLLSEQENILIQEALNKYMGIGNNSQDPLKIK